MIVREDMHTHYTQVSFKDEFQNTVVHSKNANWNQIHKRDFERLYSTRGLLSFLYFECILSGRGIQNDRTGWREQRRFRTKMDKSREAKNGGDVTSQKGCGPRASSSRGQIKIRYKYRGVVLLVVSYTPSSNFKSHLLLSKDKICDTSFFMFFFF